MTRLRQLERTCGSVCRVADKASRAARGPVNIGRGVVDQHVQPAGVALHRLGRGLNAALVADIEIDSERPDVVELAQAVG